MRFTDQEIEDLHYCVAWEKRSNVHTASWAEDLDKLLEKLTRESYRRNFRWWQLRRWFG